MTGCWCKVIPQRKKWRWNDNSYFLLFAAVRFGRVPKRSKSMDEAHVSSTDPTLEQSQLESKQLAIYDIILNVSQAHLAHCGVTDDKLKILQRKHATLVSLYLCILFWGWSLKSICYLGFVFLAFLGVRTCSEILRGCWRLLLLHASFMPMMLKVVGSFLVLDKVKIVTSSHVSGYPNKKLTVVWSKNFFTVIFFQKDLM